MIIRKLFRRHVVFESSGRECRAAPPVQSSKFYHERTLQHRSPFFASTSLFRTVLREHSVPKRTSRVVAFKFNDLIDEQESRFAISRFREAREQQLTEWSGLHGFSQHSQAFQELFPEFLQGRLEL